MKKILPTLLISAACALGASSAFAQGKIEIRLNAGGDDEAAPQEQAPIQKMSTASAGDDGAWLGLGTRKVPRIIGEHLGIAPGSGLAVEVVVPDGPAEKAGIKKDDVLTKLGDQILFNADQLSALLKGQKTGDKVALEVYRDEEARKIELTLGKRPAAYVQSSPSSKNKVFEFHGGDELEDLFGMNAPGAQGADEVRKQIEKMRKQMEQAMRQGGGMGGGNVQGQVLMFDKASVQIMDDEGSVSIENNNGKSVLTAKDKDGKITYQGPYGTPEEKARVPKAIRDRADNVQIQLKGNMREHIFPRQDKAEEKAPEIDGEVKPGDQVD